MIEETDVQVPVRTAYDQWTQFEDFPLFMDHITDVSQIDATHVHFEAKILGLTRAWDAEITEQTPDQRVAWTATDGTQNSGVITFHPLTDDTTRIVLQMEMDPSGFVEFVADRGGFVRDRAKQDLRDFKDFVEQRGRATGAYRETITRDPDHDAQRHREQLEELTHEELYALAQEDDLRGRSSMSREDLVEALAPEPANA